jgi:hypothetical protein
MATPQFARLLELTPQAIHKIAHRYVESDWNRRSMGSSVLAPPSYWTILRGNASSEWFAVSRLKARLARRCE